MINPRDTDERSTSPRADSVRRLSRHKLYSSWQAMRQALSTVRFVFIVLIVRLEQNANIGQDFVVDGGLTKAYVTPEGPPTPAPKNNAHLSEQVDAIRGTGVPRE